MAQLQDIFTNHSGGANGSDTKWDRIGRKYGFNNHRHYWSGRRTPLGNVQLTKTELEEGWQHVLKANETLRRQPWNYKDLLSRNWFQVKNSEAIYAIGHLANHHSVGGGTGWAVQMAIDSGKPVYVFNQDRLVWFVFDYAEQMFLPLIYQPPILRLNYAGIGTRNIMPEAEQAIAAVYTATLKLIQDLG